MATVTATVDSLQKSINSMFSDVHAILADNYEAPAATAPTLLEIQLAEQLKDQARQVEEMKQMLASLLEAEAARKAGKERKEEDARKAEEARKAEACKQKEKSWSCPADGCVHHWTHDGKKYLRDSRNYVFTVSKDGRMGVWKGIYLVAEDRIDESAKEPKWKNDNDSEKLAAELAKKKVAAVAKKKAEEEERKQREAAEHSMRQEDARKRSAARIQSHEFGVWNRYETQMGPPVELFTRNKHVWLSDRTPITVDGKVCVGPRLGSYMGINFGSIHWSMCGISRNSVTMDGVTYDGTVEPQLY